MTDRTLALAAAIVETIKAAGAQGAPSGPMYAACMAHGVHLDEYQSILDALVRAKLIRVSNHCAYWLDRKES